MVTRFSPLFELQVLPTLKFCAERDETVAIQLCVLGCYDAIAKRLEKLGPVATHILPACTPMLACKGLNSNQFEMAVGIVQGMLETVIKYRREQIANPSATAIIENRPTHPGGEPDEAEIARQRAIVLGGWKAAPPASSKAAPAASRPLSPMSASFPGPAQAPAPAPAPSSSSGGGGFDMADMWSAPPPPSSGSAGAQSGAFSGNLSPVSNSTAMPVAVGGVGEGSKSSGYGSASSAADMFQGLSVLEQNKGPATNGTAGGSSDPFASAGLGGAFGAMATGNAAPASGGMSWMDGSFGGAGGAANSSGSGGISNQSPGVGGGLSGLGGAAPVRAKAATYMGISPPPKPSASFSSPSPASGGGAPAGDPFAAFFDAAVAGGPGGGAASSPQQVASPSLGMMGAASGAPPAFLGGLGAGPAAATASGNGGGGGGGSLEDQLAKTQREIAQLTRELGSAGNGMMAGMAAGGGIAAAMGEGAGGVGWPMPGAPAPAGGMGMPAWPGGGASSHKQPPAAAQQGQQQANSTDPFAFLGEGGQQGGKGSGFDFF